MAVKIISDSTCDLSQEIIEKYDIEIVPLTVTLGERSGHDGREITPEDIYEYVEKSGQLPKTSAVSVGEYEKVFRHWSEKGYSIVHFCISSEFSGCFQNACIAANDIEEVYPVDSRNLSTGQGLLVLHAAEMAQRGCRADEIAEDCESLAEKVEASFVVNSIDYLRKGGRCSAMAAFGANVLQIKPCINVLGGFMQPGKKYRGAINKVIRSYVEDRLKERDDISPERIFITHTRCDDEAVEEVKSLIGEYFPEVKEVLETVAGATVTTHCGPGTLGVLFIRK